MVLKLQIHRASWRFTQYTQPVVGVEHLAGCGGWVSYNGRRLAVPLGQRVATILYPADSLSHREVPPLDSWSE